MIINVIPCWIVVRCSLQVPTRGGGLSNICWNEEHEAFRKVGHTGKLSYRSLVVPWETCMSTAVRVGCATGKNEILIRVGGRTG